ncbi:Lrp/AsnC family transcriptional regulator [Candidatus Woesearchaeota archaeon]|nr:Lrp/AsnC family transcriptional regulator [Candidatus Woesearchaeota archaeon]
MIEKDNAVLLAHLRRNARIKLTAISRKTDVPVSTIFEKINGPLRSYVQRYTCLLNNSEIGFSSRATIILKVDKEQKAEIGQHLERHPNVNSLYRINNGYDFMLDVIFKQMMDLEEFIEQLERRFRIKHKEVYFIISEVKQESFLSDPEAVKLVLEKQQDSQGPAKKSRRTAK